MLCICSIVCLSVGHIDEPCKMAEPIELPFGLWTRVGPRNHVLDWFQIPHWKGQIMGFPEYYKALGRSLHSRRDHSILNNAMPARLLPPTAMLPTSRCHTKFPLPVKSVPCDAACSQITLGGLVITVIIRCLCMSCS